MQEKPGKTSAFSLSVICNNTTQYCASLDNLYAICVPFQLSLTYYIHIWKCNMQVCRIYNLEHLVRRIMRTYYITSHLCNNWSKDKVLHSKIKAKKMKFRQPTIVCLSCMWLLCLSVYSYFWIYPRNLDSFQLLFFGFCACVITRWMCGFRAAQIKK